jgi:hypothetical protein
LAGVLRPGNAGANTAADQIEAVDEALGQLPRAVVERAELLLLRADAAGLVHDLLDCLQDADMRFSVGMGTTEDVRQAVSATADGDWVAAVSADGEEPEKVFVAELSLDLSGWPEARAQSAAKSAPIPAPSWAERPGRAGATRCS